MKYSPIIALAIILLAGITGCKSETKATKLLYEARECTSRGEIFHARKLLVEAKKRAPAESKITHIIQNELTKVDRELSELTAAMLDTPLPGTNE